MFLLTQTSLPAATNLPQARSPHSSLSLHLCFILSCTHLTFICIHLYFLLEKSRTEDTSETKAHASCWLRAQLQNLQTTLKFMLQLLCIMQMPNFPDHLPVSNVKPKVLSQTGDAIRLPSFISFSTVYFNLPHVRSNRSRELWSWQLGFGPLYIKWTMWFFLWS